MISYFSARDISGQKAAELDKTLFGLEHGVDLTLQRTKVWSKYAKDIATYLERRAHLGTDVLGVTICCALLRKNIS